VPAIDYEFDTLTSTVNQTGSSGDVYADISGISITLGATTRYLVIAIASHTNVTGSGGVTRSSEVEVRHNTTRYGVSRWCSLFGSFAPNVVAGGTLQTFFVIDATASDTVTMRLRRENVDGTDDGEVDAGQCWLAAIDIGDLDEGTDYAYADGGNSDTSEVVAGDATWITAAASGRIGQGGGEEAFTASTTGDYLVLASLESWLDGTPGAAEEGRARFRVNAAAAGTGQEHTHTRDVGSPGAYWGSFFEMDVIALTASDQPEIQWEVANDASGDSAGYRRSRIFILRLAALSDYEAIVDAGNIQVASAGIVEATNGLTFNFGTNDVLILGCASWQTAGGNWGRAWLHQDAGDVRHPALGRMWAVNDDGVGAADDEMPLLFAELVSSTGSETWRLAQETDSGANMYTLGRARGNGASARTPLVALPLQTASGASLTGTVAVSNPLATIAASGRFNHSGTVAISTPLATITASGGQQRTGTVAIASPLPTAAAAGRFNRTGTAAPSIPLATVAAAGRFERTGEATATIPLARVRAYQVEPVPPEADGENAGFVIGHVVEGRIVEGGVVVGRVVDDGG